MPYCDHDYLKYYTPKKEDVILDLGASLGEFENDNIEIFKEKNCKIICVEPTLWCLDKLANYMSDNFDIDKFIILSLGTSKENTCLSFENTSAHVLNCISSLDSTKKKYGVTSKVSKVPVISLDTLLDITGEIDFCKCDIEGGELDTFLYSKKIRKIKNLAIASYHIVNGEETYIKLKSFFESNDFEVKYEKEKYLDFEPQSMLYCTRRS